MPLDVNPYAAPTAHVEDISDSANFEAEEIRRAHLKHEMSIKSIGLLFMFGGVLGTIGLAVMAGSARNFGSDAVSLAPTALIIAMCIGTAALGYYLRRLQRWTQIPAVLLCALGLLNFPVGTLLNGYFLWLLLSAKGRFIMSAEYAAIVAATPDVKYKTSIVVKVLLAVLVGGLLLLIALAKFR